MSSPSWLILTAEAPRHRLAERPPDCGWVEQMPPFLRDFSRPGDLVVDPFCGWGTTMVACALEGRRGIGLEIEPGRAARARERLKSYAGPDQIILTADARKPPLRAASADLCLTNIPYFGAGWAEGREGQLYRKKEYTRYLEELNIVLPDGKFVPLAWDAARALSRHFVLLPERVLCYPRPLPEDPDPARTSRAHEYALIGKKDSVQ